MIRERRFIEIHKKEEAAKLKESYVAGVKETIGSFIKATGLKWKGEPTAETLGQRFRMSWDTNKNLSDELKAKDGVISEKNVEINGLRAKVTTLTEEVNGLKYRLMLIDENAVERLRNVKNAETIRADKAESELHSLRSVYESLLGKWNALWSEPEHNEAARKVKEGQGARGSTCCRETEPIPEHPQPFHRRRTCCPQSIRTYKQN